MSSQLIINPVGRVRAEQGRFQLIIKPHIKDALTELAGFSHIQILWWGHKTDTPKDRTVLISKKPYKNSPDEIGIFANRSQIRPNPVLLTTAAILSVDIEAGIVELPWIDAENDSPIIDIKPYQPCFDRVQDVRLPEWCSGWPQWQEDSGAFDWAAVFNF